MSTTGVVAKWPSLAPYFHGVLRIAAAIPYILAGAMKLFAFPVGVPPNGGTVPLLSEAGLAGVLEVFGGGLILLGLFTRPVAFILSGEMAVAYWQFHAPQGFVPNLNNGLPAFLFCFIWLYFSAAGAGAWSLDDFRRKKKSGEIPVRVSPERTGMTAVK